MRESVGTRMLAECGRIVTRALFFLTLVFPLDHPDTLASTLCDVCGLQSSKS